MRFTVRGPCRNALSVALVVLGACVDAPTAPRPVAADPIDGLPSDVVAQVGALVSLAPLSGFNAGGVTAINNKRETAGWNYTTGTAYHAFFRSPAGTMTDLGTLGGTGSISLGMNDSSSVVGFSYVSPGRYHAFVSRVSGATRTLVDLGTLVGGTRSAAYGINLGGTVVGFSTNAAGQQRAVRWVPPSYTPEELGVFAGGTTGFAYDINDAGAVVGSAMIATGETHAVRWSPLLVMTDLGTLGGTSSTARSTNNLNEIVGWSTTAAGTTHAFFRTRGAAGVMTDLGSPGGPSYAFAVSETAQTIGWAQPTVGNEQALLWNAGVTTDLGTTASATEAKSYAMNDSGMVVGTSGNQATVWFLNVNRLPIANFVNDVQGRANGTAAHFNATTSNDLDDDLLTYAWTFGDATSGTGATPSHVYTSSGPRTVTLTVTDWRGGTNVRTLSITVL